MLLRFHRYRPFLYAGFALFVLIASGVLAFWYLLSGSATSIKLTSSAGSAITPVMHARKIYAQSVVPGGVHDADEAVEAVRRDPVVAAHYRDMRPAELRPGVLDKTVLRYVSFRRKDRVYWTRRKMPVRAGELVLSSKQGAVRARCGNRLAETPQQPTLPVAVTEPTAEEFEGTGFDGSESRTPVVAIPPSSGWGRTDWYPPSSSEPAIEALAAPMAGGGSTAHGSGQSGLGGAAGSVGVPGILAPMASSVAPSNATTATGTAASGLMMPPPNSSGSLIVVTTPPLGLVLPTRPPGVAGAIGTIVLRPGPSSNVTPVITSGGLKVPPLPAMYPTGHPGTPSSPGSNPGGTTVYVPTENIDGGRGSLITWNPPVESRPADPGVSSPEPSSLVFFGTGLLVFAAGAILRSRIRRTA